MLPCPAGWMADAGWAGVVLFALSILVWPDLSLQVSQLSRVLLHLPKIAPGPGLTLLCFVAVLSMYVFMFVCLYVLSASPLRPAKCYEAKGMSRPTSPLLLCLATYTEESVWETGQVQTDPSLLALFQLAAGRCLRDFGAAGFPDRGINSLWDKSVPQSMAPSSLNFFNPSEVFAFSSSWSQSPPFRSTHLQKLFPVKTCCLIISLVDL